MLRLPRTNWNVKTSLLVGSETYRKSFTHGEGKTFAFFLVVFRYALDEHCEGGAGIDAPEGALAQHDACQSVTHVGVQHVTSRFTRELKLIRNSKTEREL